LHRAISSLIRTQEIGDLYRIYLSVKRDGMDYNIAFIPSDFEEKPKEEFDPGYMIKLFDLAYQMAKNGYPWKKHPQIGTPLTKSWIIVSSLRFFFFQTTSSCRFCRNGAIVVCYAMLVRNFKPKIFTEYQDKIKDLFLIFFRQHSSCMPLSGIF